MSFHQAEVQLSQSYPLQNDMLQVKVDDDIGLGLKLSQAPPEVTLNYSLVDMGEHIPKQVLIKEIYQIRLGCKKHAKQAIDENRP